MRQFFMVDDLKYLRRGGRISAAAQVAGSLLKIKPILQSDPEGHIIQAQQGSWSAEGHGDAGGAI